MTSSALVELNVGLIEVSRLRKHTARIGKASGSRRNELVEAAIAQRRASVVLLYSHFERYVRNFNEQAVDYINSCHLSSELIPVEMRLLQSKRSIDQLSAKEWTDRQESLVEFVLAHASFWTPSARVSTLEPGPIIEWMTSPGAREVHRYFRMWGVNDIFASITRTRTGRRRLASDIASFVDNRHGIAHGDQTVQPQAADVTRYVRVVNDFSSRVDKHMSDHLARLTGRSSPW